MTDLSTGADPAIPVPATMSGSVLRAAVRAATKAPSLHNSQPWLFRIGPQRVDVYADRGRQLEVLDPVGRELLISVGAAVFTLRLALRGAGWQPEVSYFPEPQEADLVARVSAARPLAVTPAVEALVAAVDHRHTNRWPFAPAVVPADALEHLVAAARREGAFLTVAGAVSRGAILGLTEAADRRLRALGGYRAELARWTLPAERRIDGVPRTAIGPWDALETMPIRDFGLLQPYRDRKADGFEPYPTIAVLSTGGDRRDQWVLAGQALQRVLLTATSLNLATTPISQPVEVPGLRALLTDTETDRWAQIVLRLGYGRPASATPRRPLGEVLRDGAR